LKLFLGLARRFPLDHAFNFEDYSNAEFMDIFNQTCEVKGYQTESWEVRGIYKCWFFRFRVTKIVSFRSVQGLLICLISNVASSTLEMLGH
jgi:hypothetical protein